MRHSNLLSPSPLIKTICVVAGFALAVALITQPFSSPSRIERDSRGDRTGHSILEFSRYEMGLLGLQPPICESIAPLACKTFNVVLPFTLFMPLLILVLSWMKHSRLAVNAIRMLGIGSGIMLIGFFLVHASGMFIPGGPGDGAYRSPLTVVSSLTLLWFTVGVILSIALTKSTRFWQWTAFITGVVWLLCFAFFLLQTIVDPSAQSAYLFLFFLFSIVALPLLALCTICATIWKTRDTTHSWLVTANRILAAVCFSLCIFGLYLLLR